MISRVFRLIQILSIDIVIGVVILLRFFCAQYGISPETEIYVLLGATVWLIYTIDHLKDATRSPGAKRDRYVFHRLYGQYIKIVCLVVLAGIIPLLFLIPEYILMGGVVLASFSLIYLLIQHKLSTLFSKELYVAIVYAAGILMVPVLEKSDFSFTHLVLLILLAYSNLLMFSWFEGAEDQQDGFDSIATKVNANTLERLIIVLLAVGLGLSVLQIDIVHSYFFIAFLIYTTVMLFKDLPELASRYRTIGDAVFLMPILFEWL